MAKKAFTKNLLHVDDDVECDINESIKQVIPTSLDDSDFIHILQNWRLTLKSNLLHLSLCPYQLVSKTVMCISMTTCAFLLQSLSWFFFF